MNDLIVIEEIKLSKIDNKYLDLMRYIDEKIAEVFSIKEVILVSEIVTAERECSCCKELVSGEDFNEGSEICISCEDLEVEEEEEDEDSEEGDLELEPE